MKQSQNPIDHLINQAEVQMDRANREGNRSAWRKHYLIRASLYALKAGHRRE